MIIFVKDEQMIASKLTAWNDLDLVSELLSISRMAVKRGSTFWTCMDYIDFKNQLITLRQVPNNIVYSVPISELHHISNVILFRYIGSIEAQHARIFQTLNLLRAFKGTIANQPNVIEYGLRKDYLLTLQENNYPVIQTKIYPVEVTKEEILSEINVNKKYIIKPVTGELGNSVQFLDDVNNHWMREKERIVGGWVIQPFEEDIWNGEIQMRFIGNRNILTLKKVCNRDGRTLPDQSDRYWERVSASRTMLTLATDLKAFLEVNLKLGIIHCCRFDFIDGKSGLKILECEIVNPGMGYFNFTQEERILASAELLDTLEFT